MRTLGALAAGVVGGVPGAGAGVGGVVGTGGVGGAGAVGVLAGDGAYAGSPEVIGGVRTGTQTTAPATSRTTNAGGSVKAPSS